MILANPQISKLAPYEPGMPITDLARKFNLNPDNVIKIASNENPLGCSALVTKTIVDNIDEIARYPDGYGYDLKNALAEFYQVTVEQIILGNGSNDILDLIARVFLRTGTNAIFSQYAFIVYKLVTIASGAEFKEVDAIDYAHNLNAIGNAIDENTHVIFLGNPNNPTGSWFNNDEFAFFMDKVPSKVLVVLDEAYIEYAENNNCASSVDLLGKYANLIILRTFSKAYGLAGLRIGFGLANSNICDLLNRMRQPFNVNSLAQAAAIAALQDQQFVATSFALNQRGMRQLTRSLNKLGFKCLPSKGNFIAVDFGNKASDIDLALQQHGIIVRPLAGYGMPNFLRISISTEAENNQFLNALTEII